MASQACPVISSLDHRIFHLERPLQELAWKREYQVQPCCAPDNVLRRFESRVVPAYTSA